MKTLSKWGLLLALLLSPGGFASAQSHEDPVLELMVRKGLVSQQEADAASAEQKEEDEKKPASVINLQNASVQKLEFYGDGRLRFENIDQHNHSANIVLTDRERYRLRFGADYTYSDHFKGGLELESASTGDSANQTFGGTFTKGSINVGKIYLQFKPIDELTLIAGKFSNPWYTTTDIVYSFDLNPEGGAELFNYTIPLGSGSGAVDDSDPKDATSISATTDPGASITFGLNSIQYLYVNSNESNVTPGLNNNDVLIIGEQIPVTWKVSKLLTFKVAPGFTFYTGGGNTNYDTGVPTTTGSPATLNAPTISLATDNSLFDPVFYSVREADDLDIFSAPGEFNFKVGNVPFRPYWDFELNTEGKRRIQDVYLQPNGTVAGRFGTGVTPAYAAKNSDLGDNVAWAAGLQVGSNKRKGDWSALGEFRQIGLGAVDQNINGKDFADSYANQEGLKFAAAYNFTDFLLGTVTFYDTWDYKKGLYQSLGGGAPTPSPTASSTLNLISEKSLQRVEVDLGWKF